MRYPRMSPLWFATPFLLIVTFSCGCAGRQYQVLVTKWGVASSAVLTEAEALYREASSISRGEAVAVELSIFMSSALAIHKAAPADPPRDAIAALEEARASISTMFTQSGGPQNATLPLGDLAARLEYVKALREYVAMMLALATTKASITAGDAVFEAIASGGRIPLHTGSASKEGLKDGNSQMIAGATSYVTEKIFDAQKEKHLREGLLKAGDSIEQMLEEIESDLIKIRDVQKTRITQDRDYWVSALMTELWKRERADPAAIVGSVERWLALERQLEIIALAKSEKDTPIKVFKEAHKKLMAFARGGSRTVAWEDINAELDRFLVRAKAAADARKAYLEAVASRPDATPNDAQKLLDAALKKGYLGVLSRLGVPVDLLSEE